jgi:hypothetical protein
MSSEKYTNQKCRNCGHGRSLHRGVGGITFCIAMVGGVPQKLCDCRKFEEAE